MKDNPPLYAVTMDHPRLAEILLDHRANPNITVGGKGLIDIARGSSCHEDMIELLRAYGAP